MNNSFCLSLSYPYQTFPNIITSCREKGHFISVSFVAVAWDGNMVGELVQHDQSTAQLGSERERGRGQDLPTLLELVPSVTPRSCTQICLLVRQGFSTFLKLWAVNTVPHAVVTPPPTHTLFVLPLHNYNFASVMNHNVNICHATLKRSRPTDKNPDFKCSTTSWRCYCGNWVCNTQTFVCLRSVYRCMMNVLSGSQGLTISK